jgi:MSHA pilin protein MshD
MCSEPRPAAQRGVSLVELVIFIVVVGVAVIGVLGAIGMTARSSADPMVQKQALAAAEALLEEVMLQPFSFCDPDDANAATATSAAGCTGGAGGANDESRLDPPPANCPGSGLGPEAGETRSVVGTATPFDNVSDYNGFDSVPVGGIRDLSGAPIAALAGYRAQICVTQQALGAIPATDALLVEVRVDGPAGTNTFVVLHGYRVRYAPNALP